MNDETNPDDGVPFLLAVTLQAAVPLRIRELAGLPEETRAALAREAGEVIAHEGDAILYRRPGQTARATGKLITGLACLAFAPGGVTLGNLAWCAAHPARQYVHGSRVCPECLAAERPGAGPECP